MSPKTSSCESAKLRGLCGLVGGVGTWVKHLRRPHGLHGSIKFWRGSKKWRGWRGWHGSMKFFIEKSLLNISQNLQENICAGVSS